MSTPKTSPLDNLRVAAPCSANWDEMDGDERARFCHECKLQVYNLSGMTRAEAEGLIQEKQGNLCARFYQREDGTLITENCPVGLRALRRRLAWISASFAAGFFFAASGALAMWGKMSGSAASPQVSESAGEEPPAAPPPGVAPIQPIKNWANPPAPVVRPSMIMGKICPMPPPATTPAPPAPSTPPATTPAPASTPPVDSSNNSTEAPAKDASK